MMNRRQVLQAALVTCALPLRVHAQAPPPRRIGFLAPGTGPGPLVVPFRQRLAELGWIEGQNLTIEYRWASTTSHFATHAAELVRRNVDLLVTTGTTGAVAARNATKTIPIVIVGVGDPVGSGLVVSLARPGANITGFSVLTPELAGKRLELLTQAVPAAAHIAFLRNVSSPRAAKALTEMEAVARTLGVRLDSFDVREPVDVAAVFAAVRKSGAHALYVLSDPVTYRHRRAIASAAAESGLPSMYDERGFAEAGGLLSYGASYADLYRRGAAYVDKILSGTRPGDLPIEQPTTFELVINLRTAKGLGLKIPPTLLVRADHIIE
jgi:putative ABC transport system substrate-binding protein